MNNKSAKRSINAVPIKHKRAKKSKSVEAKQDIKKVGKGLFFAIVLILIVPIVVLAGPIIKEQRASRERQKIVLPSPTVSPSLLPSNQPKTNPVNPNTNSNSDYMVNCRTTAECGGGTVYIKKSECDNSTCCQIGDKWIFYKDKNQCTRDQGQNSGSTNNNAPINLGSIKIDCNYKDSNFNFDFGKLTYDECKVKTDEYWASKRVVIPSYQPIIVSPQPPQKTAEDIQKCKDAVREKYNNLYIGCNITYQGSAVEMCQKAYQRQSSADSIACE